MCIRHKKKVSAAKALSIESSKPWLEKPPHSMLWGDVDEAQSETWKDESVW